ncbi:hypothetical protein ABL57_02400 [Kocuria sp. SM24M-10]|nr:hypothetical protein ABL57_02400 [Kocuria sp. SM24M-10]
MSDLFSHTGVLEIKHTEPSVDLGNRIYSGEVFPMLLGVIGKPSQLGQGISIVVAMRIHNGSHYMTIWGTIEHDEVRPHKCLSVTVGIHSGQRFRFGYTGIAVPTD